MYYGIVKSTDVEKVISQCKSWKQTCEEALELAEENSSSWAMLVGKIHAYSMVLTELNSICPINMQ